MSRLQGKIALITGASTGIGFQTAKTFIENGAKVIITGQNPERLAHAKKELGDQAIAIVNDVADVTTASRLASEIKEKVGHLDVAFLNAGVAAFGEISAVTSEEFDRQYNINVKGPFFQLQALLPLLKSPGASVIVTSSTVAHGGGPGRSLYSSTKAAILNLANNWAVELAPQGIRVNTISPGPIETPIFGKMPMPAEAAAGMAEAIRQSVPLKRFGLPIEIATAAVFLASDESSYMTGGEMLITGGNHL